MRWFAAMLVCAVGGWCIWTFVIPHKPVAPQPVAHKRLAPDGTFFLLERIAKQVDTGVYALQPGTEVRRVSQEGSTLIVSDGRETFEVDAWQLTNDLDVAAAAAGTENQKRRDFQSALEQQNREISEKKKQMYIENARHMEQYEQARRAAAAAARPNPLDRGAYDQKQGVTGRTLYVDDRGQRYWVDTFQQRHYLP